MKLPFPDTAELQYTKLYSNLAKSAGATLMETVGEGSKQEIGFYFRFAILIGEQEDSHQQGEKQDEYMEIEASAKNPAQHQGADEEAPSSSATDEGSTAQPALVKSKRGSPVKATPVAASASSTASSSSDRVIVRVTRRKASKGRK